MPQETSGKGFISYEAGGTKIPLTKIALFSNVMALLVDLRETGEKSSSAKINSRSLRTQSATEEPSFVPV